MTKDCKSVVFARFYPEEKVSSCLSHPWRRSCVRELVSCARIINAGIIEMIAVTCPEDCQPFVLNRCLGFKLCFVISAQFPQESCPSCWQPFSLARKLTGVRRPSPG